MKKEREFYVLMSIAKMTCIEIPGFEIIPLSEIYEKTRIYMSAIMKTSGLTFKVIYRNDGSIPLGYDNNHCLMVLENLTWKNVADYKEICPTIYCNTYDPEVANRAFNHFLESCADYIRLVYLS